MAMLGATSLHPIRREPTTASTLYIY